MELKPLVTPNGVVTNSPDTDFWDELSDPPNFIVGALILAGHKPFAVASYIRVFAACGVVGLVLAPALLAPYSSRLGLGDPLSYGLTLLCAGAVVLIPGRVYELRRGSRITNKIGYPKRLRVCLWITEVLVVLGALYAILYWKFGGGGHHHPVPRAVIWALLAVSAGDLITASACLNIVNLNALVAEAKAARTQWREWRAKRADERGRVSTRASSTVWDRDPGQLDLVRCRRAGRRAPRP
jgi:hypothetical protein